MKTIYRILPRYAFLPLGCTLVLNMITYYASRLITSGALHTDLSIPLDGMIPFVPAASSVYVLAFLSWIIGFVVISRESPQVCYEVLAGEQIAKLISLVIFLLLPTAMVRPEAPQGRDFFSWLTRIIYRVDTPDNLFPSLHCLENWICFRGALRCKKVGTAYKMGTGLFALMVFASTVLIKQHLVVDILGGVVVVEIGLWLSRRLRAGRIYEAVAARRSDKTL